MSAVADDLKSFLTGTPFFGGLEDGALDRLAARLKERAFAAGELVFREGEAGSSMYIIESGQILLCAIGAGSGPLVRLVRLGRGDFFGETTLIEMQPRPFTARVDQAARLLELSNVDLYRLYREDVKPYVMVLQNINRELCRRLRRSDSRIAAMAAAAGDERTQITQIPRVLR